MTLATVDVQLWGKQFDFVFSPIKNVAVWGGVGSGKSWAGATRGVLAALGTIGDEKVPVPNIGVVTAPTYGVLKNATIRTYLEILRPMNIITQFNKSDFTINLVNGSEIIFRTATEPDRLRGPSALWWHGDEAALYPSDVWPIMIARLRQHGRRGWAWLTTTPKGRNWAWQEFIQNERPDYDSWRLRTVDNPFIEEAYYLSLKDAYHGDFAAQELEGEFIAFEGLIFPEFRRDVHVLTAVPDHFVYTIAGVDWGFANPGVILVLGVDGDGRAWLVEEHYQRQRRIEEWVTVAQQARQTWQIKTFYCDPSEPDYIKAFRAAGLNAEQANNTVNTGLQMVKNRLVIQQDGKPRLFIRREAVNTMAEFESYQWAENRYGMKDEPVKANDHAMDSLRYAIMGLDAGRKPLEVTVSRWA